MIMCMSKFSDYDFINLKLEDRPRCPSVDVNAFANSVACCDLDLQNPILSPVGLVNIPCKFY